MRNPNTTKAYNFLRKKILAGEFAPGAFLSAQSLSKEIGISRTPVREALRQLECEELVTIVPKLGAVVKTMNDEEFQELLGFREALEVYAAGRAALMHQPEEIAHMKQMLDAMKDQVNTLMEDPQNEEAINALAELDIKFHRLIFVAARNNLIKERFERANILQRLITPSLVNRWLHIGRITRESASEVFEEHVQIFEAIRDRNRERAQAAMSRHMQALTAKVSHHARSANVEEGITLHDAAKMIM